MVDTGAYLFVFLKVLLPCEACFLIRVGALVGMGGEALWRHLGDDTNMGVVRRGGEGGHGKAKGVAG